MVEIPFPTSSAPGIRQQTATGRLTGVVLARPQMSGGRLINVFAEKAPAGAPGRLVWRRSAGLEQVASLSAVNVHTRGFLQFGTDSTFVIVNGWVYSLDYIPLSDTYTVVSLGALAGSDPVTTAKNNAASPNYLAVANGSCFNLLTGGAPTAFADADLPTGMTSVCDFDGYFIWSYDDGRIFASDLNSVAVNALSFTTEQGNRLLRVVRFGGRLFAFGDKWIGVYRNAGTSPFPLAKETTIAKGIVGTHAIAGWETGWANELIWVGDDFIVYKLQGYTPVPISTVDISRDIEDAVTKERIDRDLLEAFVYVYQGNAFWVLNCHDQWTWEFNLTTGEWNEKKSVGLPCWRGMKSVRVGDDWLIGDHDTGRVFRSRGIHTEDAPDALHPEDGDAIICQIDTGVLSNFPMRVRFPKASFNIVTGVGEYNSDPDTADRLADPKVLISYSVDGGSKWSQPLVRRLGGPGQTNSYPSLVNCGVSRGQGIRYRLELSDPVDFLCYGGTVDDPQPRAWAG